MTTALFGQHADEARLQLECGHRVRTKPGAVSAWCPICTEQVPVLDS